MRSLIASAASYAGMKASILCSGIRAKGVMMPTATKDSATIARARLLPALLGRSAANERGCARDTETG